MLEGYEWQCMDCGHQWPRGNDEHSTPEECPECGSDQITTIGQARIDEAINARDDYREEMRRARV